LKNHVRSLGIAKLEDEVRGSEVALLAAPLRPTIRGGCYVPGQLYQCYDKGVRVNIKNEFFFQRRHVEQVSFQACKKNSTRMELP
jgi:hypothetical protein